MRSRLVAPLVAAALTGGALLGHHLPRPEAPEPVGIRACATEDDPGPCHWDAVSQGNGRGHSFTIRGGVVTYEERPVTRREALLRYLDAYAGNGCPADFEANYRGTRYIADLEGPAQDEIAWLRIHDPEVPAFIDYGEGSAIEVRNDQVILVDAYDGACEK